MDRWRMMLGLCLWLGAVAGGGWWLETRVVGKDAESQVAPELWDYLTGHRQTVALALPARAHLEVGDPIFWETSPGEFRQIGELTSVDGAASRATALFYASAPPLSDRTELASYTTPDSIGWVLETMLPPENRRAITHEIRRALANHQEEILASLRPIVEASLDDGLEVIEEDLKVAIRRHRGELETLSGRYQRELVEREIVPLVRQEIWPIVRERAEPLANEIGLELWERVSLWRFTWRYLYDLAPLPERHRLEGEWARFLAEEVFPLLEERNDDLVRTVQQILNESARNPRVQEAARKSLAKAIDDAELRQIVWQILREVIVDNPRLREVIERHWKSPEARRAFEIASDRLEPSVEQIGALLFGTQDEGITPEFARVLRSRILDKDHRWLVLRLRADARTEGTLSAELTVRDGGTMSPSPFVRIATGGASPGGD